MSRIHPYFQRSSRPADLVLAPHMGMAPAASAGLAVRGLEVVQSIQSVDNSVRLIADKATIVRLYVDPTNVGSDALVTGELAWRHGGGGFSYLPAMNRVKVSPGMRPTLQEQRFDLAQSINFHLPPEALREGKLQMRVERLNVPGGSDIVLIEPPSVEVLFRRSPLLRVRAIGLRYKDPTVEGGSVTPDALHFNFLRSYLRRAYPVAELEWSQLVVDADLLAPPFGDDASDLANAQLAAIRAREVSAGIDPRTHYYGLVSDDGRTDRFMRGSALYDGANRVFGVIASGPAGVPAGWAGDSDASYADWYGAHELGHTFQRRHPGFPVGKQPRDPDEKTFPYANGLISTPDHKYVGFDVGDPMLPLPMRALPGNIHHDVMTYDTHQWLSAYTYEAIHERLLDEEVRLVPGD